jgi:hypothetical protein
MPSGLDVDPASACGWRDELPGRDMHQISVHILHIELGLDLRMQRDLILECVHESAVGTVGWHWYQIVADRIQPPAADARGKSTAKSERRLLAERLASLGLRVGEVVGDGRCLFYSALCLLRRGEIGTQERARDAALADALRKLTIEHAKGLSDSLKWLLGILRTRSSPSDPAACTGVHIVPRARGRAPQLPVERWLSRKAVHGGQAAADREQLAQPLRGDGAGVPIPPAPVLRNDYRSGKIWNSPPYRRGRGLVWPTTTTVYRRYCAVPSLRK